MLGLSGLVLSLGLLLSCGLMRFESFGVLLNLAADRIVVLRCLPVHVPNLSEHLPDLSQ